MIVTASYWGFTLVDGALRMLVLLHFFRLGYTPFTLAFLFLLYEVAGIVANLGGGWLALALRHSAHAGGRPGPADRRPADAVGARPGLDRGGVRRLGGDRAGHRRLAKDVTKTASKSAIKATSAEGNGQLFRWVAWFTGSKNAMKGIGFFVGGLLLDVVGFQRALWLMAALIGAIFVAGLLFAAGQLGKAKSSKTMRELFAKSRGVNLLAAARIFMFGARDVWFVVGLPVFLYANGWRFLEVGGFLAVWTIGYGVIQAVAPPLVRAQRRRPEPRGAGRPAVGGLLDRRSAGACAGCCSTRPVARPIWLSSSGWRCSALPFAVNSSLHSYLILAYAGSEKAAEDVGFYYAANATGRLARHPAVRRALSARRHDGLPAGLGCDADRVLADHAPAAVLRDRAGRGTDGRHETG